MLNFSSNNPFKVFPILLICFMAFSNLKAQQVKSVPDIEKIYLHTDRDNYVMGEDLWYKVYSVYAYNNMLYSKSNLLYVELISPDSEVLSRNKTFVEEGLGYGDFKLTDSIGVKPGKYQIRAYTNWNRNFGGDFVFEKTINIIDVFEDAKRKNQGSSTKRENMLSSKSKHSDKNLKIEFFPEGGSLLENTLCTVAFKVTDNYGNPIDVKGQIFNSKDELVTLFSTVHEGMGKFQFQPQKGQHYYAKITGPDQIDFQQDLPKANPEGYNIAYHARGGKKLITIKTNQETFSKYPNQPLTLICKTRGVTYFTGTQALQSNVLTFELPDTNFPEGISQITLFDNASRPQSERLVYVEKEKDVNISLQPSKSIYKPNEAVIVNVSSTLKTGEAVPGSFSFSATDMNGEEQGKSLGSNICSYFLMESDIRGKIINPGYYFNPKNPYRLEHLDLLLLTQGWRDFKWKTMPQRRDSIFYQPEKDFAIRGMVKQVMGSKPKENSNVTLGMMGPKGMEVYNTLTDELGRFKFDSLMVYGNTKIFLNARDEKGKSKGKILWSPKKVAPLEANFTPKPGLVVSEKNDVSNSIYRKYVSFGVLPENVLDEVEIIAQKKDDGPKSLYGRADEEYIIDDKTPRFSDIFQLIQYTVPGVSTVGGTIGFIRNRMRPALIMIDGIEWQQSDLRGINTDDIAKIEAFVGPSTAIFGSRGGNGVILLYTKTGSINRDSEKYHSVSDEIEGFYMARTFYAPNPQELSDPFENSKFAVRNTVHWAPYVHPNDQGNAQVTFYNSGVETQVKLTLEGVTASGIPVVKESYYTTEK